jgi:hypothetical protein
MYAAPAAGRVEHISCSQRLLNWLASNLLMKQVGGFSPGTPVSSTNKSDCHDITEILLKVGDKAGHSKIKIANQEHKTINQQCQI